MQNLQDQVNALLPAAINKAILATALTRENNTWPEPDTRPADVVEFEAQLQDVGMSPATALVASKLVGSTIKVEPARASVLKLHFPAVLVVNKPRNWDGDTYHGLPFGVPAIVSIRRSRHDNVRFRIGGKSYDIYYNDVCNDFFIPATDEQIATAITDLFTARPATTVKLFNSEDTGEVE